MQVRAGVRESDPLDFCIDVLPQADIHAEVASYREARHRANRSFDFSQD